MKRDAVTLRLVGREIRHFHGFHGSGGGGKGFNRGQARVGNMLAKPRCIGGFDVNPASVSNFQRMTGVAGTVLDAFSREQYTAFHGKAPPAGWREATPQDIQRAAGGERPHIVFLSSPCKGLSGLLSASKSKAAKYIALNELTLRGVWLMLEAWGDDPPELMVLENVPGLLTRGRPLVDQITALLHAYGYAVAESVHDCGELGGLAQTRKRCLIVARHVAKVSAMLYEPPRRRLRAVGDVLQHLALPGDPGAGPMHRVPNLAWKTWVRLAFVQAGSDWRSLNRLAVQDGVLRDYLIVPCGQEGSGCYGVRLWSESTGTVQGRSGPSNGAFSVADPRAGAAAAQYQQYGVRRWQDSSGAVTGQSAPGGDVLSGGPALRRSASQQRLPHRALRGVGARRHRRHGLCRRVRGRPAPHSTGQALDEVPGERLEWQHRHRHRGRRLRGLRCGRPAQRPRCRARRLPHGRPLRRVALERYQRRRQLRGVP